jgi:very-short-patch-repair endonuclease
MTDEDTSPVARRRKLRQTATKPEQLMWAALRDRRLSEWKFRRQFSIGPYIADFVCMEQGIVVEIDGGYHDAIAQRDTARQTYLENLGYRVIQFTNEEVLESWEGVVIALERMIKNPNLKR